MVNSLIISLALYTNIYSSMCVFECVIMFVRVEVSYAHQLATRVVARFFSSPVASVLGASLFKKQQRLLCAATDRDRRPLSAAVTSDRPPQLERPQREHWHFVVSTT